MLGLQQEKPQVALLIIKFVKIKMLWWCWEVETDLFVTFHPRNCVTELHIHINVICFPIVKWNLAFKSRSHSLAFFSIKSSFALQLKCTMKQRCVMCCFSLPLNQLSWFWRFLLCHPIHDLLENSLRVFVAWFRLGNITNLHSIFKLFHTVEQSVRQISERLLLVNRHCRD